MSKFFYTLLAIPFLVFYHTLIPIGPFLFLLDREDYWAFMDMFMPWRD